MKLQFMALDENAWQAVGMGSSREENRREICRVEDIGEKSIPGYFPIVVVTHIDVSIVESIAVVASKIGKFILIFPDNDRNFSHTLALSDSSITMIPVVIESLPTISISMVVGDLETLFSPVAENEIYFGDVPVEKILQKDRYCSFIEAEGKNLKEAALSLVRKSWEIYSSSAVALIIYSHPDIPLLLIDEILDLVESRISPQIPFVVRTFGDPKMGREVRLSLCMARYLPPGTTIQSLIEKEETYLMKAGVILDYFARSVISGEQADSLATDNGIDPKDLYTLYTIFYEYPVNITNLLKKMRLSSSKEERVKILSETIAENVLDDTFVDEVSAIFSIPLEEIRQEVEKISEAGSQTVEGE